MEKTKTTKEAVMGCPNLAIKEVPWCVTVEKPYSPSVYQFKEYCSRRRHTICPFFNGYHHNSGCRTAV